MDIKFIGHSSFVIRGKTGTVLTDPYDPQFLGAKFPKVEADIVTLSHNHDDHNARNLAGGEPLVIDIPGEYEKKGIRVTGFATFHDKKKGEERGKNTIFKIEIDGISILHCGDLGHMLTNEIVEQIDGVDVVLVPVGGFYTIDADEARQLIEKLEPSIVIPMHYKAEGFKPEIMKDLAPLSDFLSKIGVTEAEPVKKVNVKKADLGEETKVIVMEHSV